MKSGDKNGMSEPQTIYIGQDEDITSVIDHLSAAEGEKIMLIIPEGAEIFSSVVNLRLLKREAALQSKEIILVSSDKMGEYLAEKAQMSFERKKETGVAVKTSLKSAPRVSGTDKKDFSLSSEYYNSLAKKTSFAGSPVLIRKMVDIISPPKPIQKDSLERAPEARKEASEIFAEGSKQQSAPAAQLGENKKDNQEPQNPGEEIPEIEVNNQAEDSGSYLAPSSQIYATPYLPPIQPAIEDYASSQNYKQAENSYLAKYSQNSARLAEPDFDGDSFQGTEEKISLPRSEKSVLQGKLKKIIIALVVFGALTFIFAAYFILPKADLTLTLKRDSTSFNLEVLADKNLTKIDYSLKKIPAQLVKVEKKETKEFPATGVSSGSAKAKGIITIYNAFSASPQTLVQSTRFVSVDTKKTFRITKSIVVPAAKMESGKLAPSSIEAEVIADQAGTDYNIGPEKFNIPGFEGTPKYTGFYGKSSGAMSGGSQGSARIVSAQDIEKAKKEIEGQIEAEAYKELEKQVPSNLKLLDGALKHGEAVITFSKQAGEAAEKFTASLSINLSALVFDENSLNDLIDKTVAASIENKKEALTTTRQLDYKNSRVDFDNGQIKIELAVQEDFVYKINTENLKKSLAGKNEGEIKLVLGQMPEILNAKVSLWPFWVRSIPNQADKINIIIE